MTFTRLGEGVDCVIVIRLAAAGKTHNAWEEWRRNWRARIFQSSLTLKNGTKRMATR